tara:strand:- start:621 stop:1349 length:729 start_codon:yes stop_codon:yes gene_type:complete
MTENHSIASGSDRVSRLIDTAETSGITRLSRTDSESEGEHLRRVAEELSGSGENRLRVLESLLSDRNFSTRLDAALELGKIGSFKSIVILRNLLLSQDESSWQIAIHGLRKGGSREGWLCLESVAMDDAKRLDPSNFKVSELSFRRLMAMGRTKMMDRLFRASDGHSRSISGDVARHFSVKAVSTLPYQHKAVMEHRLGIITGVSATPSATADALGIDLEQVRAFELEAWNFIHSPIQTIIE